MLPVRVSCWVGVECLVCGGVGVIQLHSATRVAAPFFAHRPNMFDHTSGPKRAA